MICLAAEDETTIRTILDHFRKLRESVSFMNAVYVVFIESNMMFPWSDRIASLLKRYNDSVMIISRDSSGEARPGVITTPGSKLAGVIRLQALLQADNVRFTDEFISVNMDPVTAQHRLCNELRQYKALVKVPIDQQFGKFTVSFSGKAPGQKDDCSTSAHQLVERVHEVLEDRDFIAYLRDKGKVA